MYDTEEFIAIRRMLHLSNLLVHKRTQEMKQQDLTFVQAEALIFFDKQKGARALDLKEYFSISHQAARNIVERLMEKNYVYTKVSEEDSRAKKVFLTEQGSVVCEEMKQLGVMDGFMLLEGIGSENRTRLLELLKIMIDNIK